jgi:hypothetical protein
MLLTCDERGGSRRTSRSCRSYYAEVIYIMVFRARAHDVLLVRHGPYSKAAGNAKSTDGFASSP